MKAFVLLIIAITAVYSLETGKLWKEYKVNFQKKYTNEQEENRRFKIFQEKIREIQKHNDRYNKGEVSYYMGLNQFSDLTHEEFVKLLNLRKKISLDLPKTSFKIPVGADIPDSIDWREKNVVSEVKNQDGCLSCWAFSTTGALEGQFALKYNKLVSLSEQNLLDCSDDYGNGNCVQGGIMRYAFKYVKDYGINSEEDYPYEAEQKECRYNTSQSILHISGYEVIERNEEALKYAVALNGPISVAIDVTYAGSYSGGIYSDASCGNQDENLNHGVLVVGYGTENGLDYWIVKNSWSDQFGEKGYIRMQRNANNLCGIVNDASRPLVI
ncbi:unnamed protein product [Psylliodes chrysocephalus]|uniref:Uncharacterized protein n=1 Tax=Psylliodes chrysocephalus TaxID=3402493 RepID=A0A9P0D2Y4_9CUCU|nr:unnamed protein product [Psylliodes chrysocephala]